jgi:AcrR family transcriptional regulator
MSRSYTKKKRAESEAETRRRIVEAAVELHQAIGPSATTFTDIAERAGVGRVTVYRHFADEDELLQACSGHYWERHPAPDPEAWKEISDPTERLRTALEQTYAYHRRTEAMMNQAFADRRDHEVMKTYLAHWQAAAELLAAPFRRRGREGTLLLAAIGHALGFETWRSLVREQGLSDEQAVEVAMRLAGDR